MKEEYQVGEKILFTKSGHTYPTIGTYFERNTPMNTFAKLVKLYINRYKPINAYVEEYGKHKIMCKIESGYASSNDLCKRKDLIWKIQFIMKITDDFSYYVISSNKHHMLVVNKSGISKI